MEESQTEISGFAFSAQTISTLGSDQYCLANIAIDCSGSMYGEEDNIAKVLRTVVDTLQNTRTNPKADSTMLRVVLFESGLSEQHGFMEVLNVDPASYKITTGGMTVLNDASAEGVEAILGYAKLLDSFDFMANGLNIVITDGEDNPPSSAKRLSLADLKQRLDLAHKAETLESLKTLVIGVGSESSVKAHLDQEFVPKSGWDQHIWLGDLTEKGLAKLAGLISHSISSQSQALGTGGPSKNINPADIDV